MVRDVLIPVPDVFVQIACGFAWAVRGSERLVDRGFRHIGVLCTFFRFSI